MLYRKLGRTDKRIPALGLGTWGMGGWHSRDHTRDRELVGVIRAAIEMGITHIDSAEMYGAGHAEELVGEAIKGFDREKLFIVTKVLPSNLKRERLLNSLNGSLRRLVTDYIDLYLIHWHTPGAPLREALETMSEAVKEGQIRHIGVSNFGLSLLKKAMRLSPVPIVNNQVLYNIQDRKPEREGLVEFCQKEGITLTAYSPVKPIAEGTLKPELRKAVESIAEEHDATPYQIALAWLLAKDGVIAIPKTSTVEHVQENLGALNVRLRAEEILMLDEAG